MTNWFSPTTVLKNRKTKTQVNYWTKKNHKTPKKISKKIFFFSHFFAKKYLTDRPYILG